MGGDTTRNILMVALRKSSWFLCSLLLQWTRGAPGASTDCTTLWLPIFLFTLRLILPTSLRQSSPPYCRLPDFPPPLESLVVAHAPSKSQSRYRRSSFLFWKCLTGCRCCFSVCGMAMPEEITSKLLLHEICWCNERAGDEGGGLEHRDPADEIVVPISMPALTSSGRCLFCWRWLGLLLLLIWLRRPLLNRRTRPRSTPVALRPAPLAPVDDGSGAALALTLLPSDSTIFWF